MNFGFLSDGIFHQMAFDTRCGFGYFLTSSPILLCSLKIPWLALAPFWFHLGYFCYLFGYLFWTTWPPHPVFPSLDEVLFFSTLSRMCNSFTPSRGGCAPHENIIFKTFQLFTNPNLSFYSLVGFGIYFALFLEAL